MNRATSTQQPEATFDTLPEARAAATGVICRGNGCPGNAEPYWLGTRYGGYVLRCSMDRAHRITAPSLSKR